MAVPANFTSLDFSGKFTKSSSLSDSADAILAQQGIGWMKRKAIEAVPVTLFLRHFTDDAGVERIEVSRAARKASAEKAEEIVLDWVERQNDGMLGPLVSRARRVQVAELDVNFLKQGWITDTVKHGLVQTHVHSDKPWTAIQCWGIEEIQGERRYTRRIKFTGGKGDIIEVRFVYDYRECSGHLQLQKLTS
ncbi:hypothetical protein K438DRAFT_1603820 [Mycena galopus ATCC 62051]|nr:hypothetical protein K438DRAFT_1603820 [Mycena galopus ATCC 62051]